MSFMSWKRKEKKIHKTTKSHSWKRCVYAEAHRRRGSPASDPSRRGDTSVCRGDRTRWAGMGPATRHRDTERTGVRSPGPCSPCITLRCGEHDYGAVRRTGPDRRSKTNPGKTQSGSSRGICVCGRPPRQVSRCLVKGRGGHRGGGVHPG